MKKTKRTVFATLLMAGAMLASLAGCAANESTSVTTQIAAESSSTAAAGSTAAESTAATEYSIAIVKQMDHASLDEIAAAVEARLDEIAAEQGISIRYTTFSGGNGDATILNQIGAQVIGDGYDAIIPIATTAAQLMVNAAEDTQTPVIYAAVSDPAEAGLTDIDYVTGTSDALNADFILDMMFAQNPDIQTVGLLYSLSEPNSVEPIAQAKAYLEANNIPYVEKTGNTTDEIITALSSMLDQVDAIFTPTDNVVMAAELTIADTLIEAGVPHYTGADSFVRNGAFATSGVNYTELGAYTADMAVEVLQTGVVPAYHIMAGGVITVNIETAEGLGADYSVFAEMAGEVVEVVTTEE